MARRYYSSTAVETTLSGSISNSATSITVTALSGFPNTTPWTAILDEGTASEELVEVTNVAGTTLTVSRGVDGTSAVAHNAGASFKHGVSGRDFDEANSHVNASSGVHGLTGSVVGTSDTQSLTNKTINSANNTLTVAQSAVTNLTTDLAAKAPSSNPTFTGQVIVPAGSASAPAISPTGDTNTGIFSDTADTLSISTGGTERVRVSSGGRLILNHTADADSYLLQAYTTDGAAASFSRYSATATGPVARFIKSRSATIPVNTVVQSGDALGTLAWHGADGTSLVRAAAIVAEVDGTPGTNDMPGRLSFQTTADGASSTTERMRIDSNGLITGTGTSLGAWTSYTPTLGGTGWAIGNGTASGFYCQIGKVMFVRVNVLFGSTSTFGTGGLTCSLPANANGNFPAASAGLVRYTDTSASAIYLGAGGIASNVFAFQSVTSATGQVAALVNSAPFTWADTDIIRLSMAYEIA